MTSSLNVIIPEFCCFSGKPSKETATIISCLRSQLLYHLSPISCLQSHLLVILFPTWDHDIIVRGAQDILLCHQELSEGYHCLAWPCDQDKCFGPSVGAVTLEGASVPTNHILPL